MALLSNSQPQLPPLVVTRILQAPPAMVFRAWSSVEHLRHSFAPAGFTIPEAEIDFRPGGVFAVCMRSPDGQDFWSRGHYLEIMSPERLVFHSEAIVRDLRRFAAHTTATFGDAGCGTTRLSVRQEYELFDPDFARAIQGASEGWRTTLDRLEAEVVRICPGSRSAVHGHFQLERRYPATPAQVFHALSDPVAKSAWFTGGDNFEEVERSVDFRVGGREVLRGRWASGMTTFFDAVYLDIVANARIVYGYQMSLDDRKISVSLTTFQLFPNGAGTRLVFDEQGVYLDGYEDSGSRERGSAMLLDRLGAALLQAHNQPD